MRIQHNITALNAYRNLSSNNGTVSKSLEKLSSGYRINRAGDDAAGLAISEKMRAQITGLDTAEKNANDGISLVQTAEGALTEVHSMLNRMVELAEQSANGTYQDNVDRENIQKEVTSLTAEIDRISEGTNFNGINLLDGSLGSSSAKDVAVDVKYSALSNNPSVLSLQGASKTESVAKVVAGKLEAGKTYSLNVTFSDANGQLQTKSVSFDASGTAGGAAEEAASAAAINKAFEDVFGSEYTVTNKTGEFTIQANKAGTANKMEIFKVDVKNESGESIKDAGSVSSSTLGEDAYYQLDTKAMKAYTDAAGDKASDHIFEINGQKFAFATAAGASKLDPDVNYVIAAKDEPADTEVKSMVELINNKTGIGAAPVSGTDTSINLKAGTSSASKGNGLVLQIGDTNDKYNKLTVNVGDMSASSLGIAGIDLRNQGNAGAAIKRIKEAKNIVSSTRGDLGAIQNRLEHTINSLKVTNENMTAAESRIRDVDMASEMMSYTKNNILVQASQAMLAQANQTPQGVLQLLQ